MTEGTMLGSRARAAARSALAGAAAVLAGAALAPGALAAPDTTPAESVGAVTGTVESAPIAMLTPQQSMTAVVSVENLATAPVDGARVLLRVTREPLADREALANYLEGDGAAMVTVGSSKVGETVATPAEGDEATTTRLAGRSTATLSVTSRQARLPFDEDTWAVHGVEVVLATAAGDATLMTGAVTWVDAPMPTLTLSAVATASGASAQVRSIVAATDIEGVTLAIDQTALSDLGAGTLDLSGRDAMRLPAQDPDLVSLAHADETTLLDYALDRSHGGREGVLEDTPWLAVAGHADRTTARLAASKGAAAMLVTDDASPDANAVVAAVTTTTAGDHEVTLLSPDPTLSGYVAAEGTAAQGTVGAAIAAGALTAAEAVSPVLLWTGDEWSPSTSDEAAALTALMSAPFVESTSVASLIEEPSGVATQLRWRRDRANDMDATAITGLATRLSDLTDLSAVAADPSTILDPGGRTLLSPLARTVRGDTLTRDLRATAATAAVDETLGALHVAAGSDVNFIAAQGALPVTVVNNLDVDATVVVDMTSFSPNLQIRESPTVTVPARSSTTVPVEVSAVSSANVRAITVLRNADGVAIADPVSMSVRVRADWGTAVTAVFTAGLVVLLVMGVIRTVRRGRKETRTTDASDDATVADHDEAR